MFAKMKKGESVLFPTINKEVPDRTSNYGSQDRTNNYGPQAKVFNIPVNSDEKELQDFFSDVGDVKFVRVLPVRDGKTTAIGFIQFATESEVQKAVAEKDNSIFNGSNLHVIFNNRDRNDEQPRTNSSQNQGGRQPQVKVFNIPNGTDKSELMEKFNEAGNVTHVKILPCREGKDVTLGFVHYETLQDVNRAVSQLNDVEFNGSKLRVFNGDPNSSEPAKSDQKSNMNRIVSPYRSLSPNNLDEKPMRAMGRGAQLLTNISNMSQQPIRKHQAKIFGIPLHSTEEEVKQLFSQCGTVKFVKIMPLRDGKDTHLVFVDYATEDEVLSAVSDLDGYEFNGSILKVMSGSGQTNQNTASLDVKRNRTGDMLNFRSMTGRIPREERSEQNWSQRNHSDFLVPDEKSNECHRCGEMGHWARECQNAPVSNGPQAVTYIPPELSNKEQDVFTQGINEGINFDKYENIPVELTGNKPTKPISNFNKAGLHQICQANIMKAKYQKPTPVQKYAIPAVLQKRDLMACAQTGSGKTAAFLLPIITNILNDGCRRIGPDSDVAYPQALVLAPTRELVSQIFMEVRKFSFNSPLREVVVYGGVNVAVQAEKLKSGCHVLVATPGRLNDFIKRGYVSFEYLQYLIFDEADRMLDMGFGPQIDNIISHSNMPQKGRRNTLMFSATFPEEIQQMATKYLEDYLFLTVGRVGGTCADVHQSVIPVPGKSKRSKLEEILQQADTDRTLVFVEKKKDADFLATYLSQRKYPTTSLNGDRTQQERELALKDFRKGVAPVLVATSVAARGLDINDVKHVINYDLPYDVTEYVHRIGRTGRIGNKGRATAFFDGERDQKIARGLVKLLSDAEQNVPDWLEDLALSAIGTGYGPDKSQFQDRRTQQTRSERFPVGSSGSAFKSVNNTPPSHKNNVADDDDEEW